MGQDFLDVPANKRWLQSLKVTTKKILRLQAFKGQKANSFESCTVGI